MNAVLEIDSKRRTWDNSPELRDSVRDDLAEWGQAMRGGMPDLGYPHEQPFSVTPSKSPPAYNADKVDLITVTLTRMMIEFRKMGNLTKRAQAIKLMMTLRFHFTSDRPAEAKAKIIGVSRATFWRRVDEAMFRFWVEHNRES